MAGSNSFVAKVNQISKKQKCILFLVAQAFNPVLGRQRLVDFCEFGASLIFRPSRLHREILFQELKKKKEKKIAMQNGKLVLFINT